MPAWLKDAVFYEIYPQSFCDSNGDGIGDFNGIISKLDYIKDLGCNALWINPCFDSPFNDAGYDVRDYKKAAPRYGTNEDLIHLFEEAHKRDMHVFLDLVPGHTSEEHEWFKASARAVKNEYSGRYIWTDMCFNGDGMGGYPYIAGAQERSGVYVLNFFKCQPALNYGWLNPDRDWKDATDSENARATIEAMKDVMRFWMDRGCDGFRVDMASSLVKGDDEKKTGTCAIWTEVRAMFDQDYPECALVAEWSDPCLSIPAGYHMDFLLNEPDSPQTQLARDYQNHSGGPIFADPWFTGYEKAGRGQDHYEDHSFFRKDAGGDITAFMESFSSMHEKTKDQGYISLLTCNHDTVRPSFALDPEELKLYTAFLFTMPTVPFLYYGDEIGMRYLSLKTKEGGYYRTGSRTPMQWTGGKNLGFSDADASRLYLPVDEAADAPNVEDQEKREDSLLCTIKGLLKLRAEDEDLRAEADCKVLYMEKNSPLLVYARGKRIIALNTSSKEMSCSVSAADAKPVWAVGTAEIRDGSVSVGPQSFAIF